MEVKAVPIEKKDLGDSERVSQPDPLTFGGHPQPPLDVPYEVTINNKTCFYAITIMKAYQNYSFEELRFMSPAIKRTSESMLVRPNDDGSYSAAWTPSSVGWYSLMITIDGYDMEDVNICPSISYLFSSRCKSLIENLDFSQKYKVEVKESPQGMQPPTQNVVKKPQHQPSRLRKFVAKNSAGLRIRAHPSLQSEQIGIVSVNDTIAFIDEVSAQRFVLFVHLSFSRRIIPLILLSSFSF